MLPLMKEKVITGNGFAFVRFGAWKHPTAVVRRVFTSGYRQDMHFHDFPQVWYCHAGRYLHQVEQSVYNCGAGSFFVIPPGVQHGFLIPEGYEADIFCIEVKYSLFIDASLENTLNAAANLLLPCFGKELEHKFPTLFCLGEDSREKAGNYLSDLALLDFKSSEADMDLIFSRLEGLFSLPELALPEQFRRKALRLAEQKALPVVRAMAYINESYTQKITAQDLMWVAALCHTDFYNCFKRFTGLTFTDYLLQLRTSRVEILLRGTTYYFSRIAELCGFADAAHMSKCYKRLRGRLLKDVRGKRPTAAKAASGAAHKLRDGKAAE